MQILIVVEKPSIVKIIKEYMSNHESETENSFDFLTYTPTFHINNYFLGFRTDDKMNIYCRRELEENAEWLTLKKAEIPIGTYFQIKREESSETDFSKYDKIIFMPDNDTDGIFGMQKFAEVHHISNAYFYAYTDLTENQVLPVFKLENVEDFDVVFESTYEKAKEKHFEADYPRKADIEKLRKQIGWTRKQFSDYFKIPYRTVENWEFFENQMPEYLYDLILYKLQKEQIL